MPRVGVGHYSALCSQHAHDYDLMALPSGAMHSTRSLLGGFSEKGKF